METFFISKYYVYPSYILCFSKSFENIWQFHIFQNVDYPILRTSLMYNSSRNLKPIFSHICNNTTSKWTEEKFLLFLLFDEWRRVCIFVYKKTTIIVFLSLVRSCNFPAPKTRQDYQMRKTSSYHIMENRVLAKEDNKNTFIKPDICSKDKRHVLTIGIIKVRIVWYKGFIMSFTLINNLSFQIVR